MDSAWRCSVLCLGDVPWSGPSVADRSRDRFWTRVRDQSVNFLTVRRRKSMPNPGAMSVLRVCPIFRDLPRELLEELATLCSNREYRPGQIVFEEGAPGTKLYGLISGRLIITT